MKLTYPQLVQWFRDRKRQSQIYTFSTAKGLRGYWLRRCNNGVALRTYRAAKANQTNEFTWNTPTTACTCTEVSNVGFSRTRTRRPLMNSFVLKHCETNTTVNGFSSQA